MIEKIVFGAGCFWHVQYTFSKAPGVLSTAVGYMGGDELNFPNPSYQQICENEGGYAEVVQVEFDTQKTKFSKLLDFFWEEHDPTIKYRQGSDFGSQYRSAIFYYSDRQKKEAEKSKKESQKKIFTKNRYRDKKSRKILPG